MIEKHNFETYKKWIVPGLLTVPVIALLRFSAVNSSINQYWANTYALSITMSAYTYCNFIPDLFEKKYKIRAKVGCLAFGIASAMLCVIVEYYDTALYECIGLSFCMLNALLRQFNLKEESLSDTKPDADKKTE